MEVCQGENTDIIQIAAHVCFLTRLSVLSRATKRQEKTEHCIARRLEQ